MISDKDLFLIKYLFCTELTKSHSKGFERDFLRLLNVFDIGAILLIFMLPFSDG